MDNEIELNSQVIRGWLRKHSTINVIIGFGCAFGFAYILNGVFQVSESISTILGWVSFFALMIWVENGIAGLKKSLGLTLKVTKWLLVISIIIFMISLFTGWVGALPPTTIIIFLLLYLIAQGRQ